MMSKSIFFVFTTLTTLFPLAAIAEEIDDATCTPHPDRKPCSLYLAPSTVPNSGIGLFTTRSIPIEWSVHEYASYCEMEEDNIDVMFTTMWTDIFVPIWNRDDRPVKFADYIWPAKRGVGFDDGLDGDVYECEDGRRGRDDTGLISEASVFAFGIASLANSHPTLFNIGRDKEAYRMLGQKENHKAMLDFRDGHEIRPEFVDLTAPFDAGVGAFQPTYGNDFLALRNLKEGQELFLNYGKPWHRRKKDAAAESTMKASDTIKSLDWLKENGVCVFDGTITAAPTKIPHAARGAYATRNINKGEVIAISPIVVMTRDDLKVSKSYNGGYQMLLNYAFGHADSSLLLLPTAPAVEYINNSVEKTNVEIRWPYNSSASVRKLYGENAWLDKPLSEVLEMSGKIAIEYIATKDIKKGEEILLNYGDGWDKSWNDFKAMHPYERSGYFRREIGVPHDFYPESWLDLKR